MAKQTIVLKHPVVVEGKLLHKGDKLIVEELDDVTNEDMEETGDSFTEDDDSGVYEARRLRAMRRAEDGDEDKTDDDAADDKEDEEKKDLKRFSGDEINMDLFPL